MARTAYARRYAQAVFQIAREKQELDSWLSDLGRIGQLNQDAVLMALLGNPRLRFEDKAKLLSERLPDVNPLALNLAFLLAAKNRFELAGEIAAEYRRLVDSHRGIEAAEVITAVPIDDEDKARLTQRLEAVVGKKVTLTHAVDASLLGGVVARVGGKLLDGSTRSRLKALRAVLGGENR